MSMLILCTGKPLSPLEGSYTSSGFDAAAEAAVQSAAEAPAERRISPGGRVVYIAEGLPVEKWLRKAAAQRRVGSLRQPESRDAVNARADALIRKLEEAGGDSLLITCPIFLAELLDRFRVHSYVVQRSGLFRLQPLEKIVVSRKEEHCGGCQHNCFLSNPGCGVGRDKAMRRKG